MQPQESQQQQQQEQQLPDEAMTAIDLAAESMQGDLRDWVLGELRTMKKPMGQHSEAQQRDIIERIHGRAYEMIYACAKRLWGQGLNPIPFRIEGLTVVDGKCTVKVTTADKDDIILSLVRSRGRELFVSGFNLNAFQGERAPALIQTDQMKLPIDGAATTAEQPLDGGQPQPDWKVIGDQLEQDRTTLEGIADQGGEGEQQVEQTEGWGGQPGGGSGSEPADSRETLAQAEGGPAAGDGGSAIEPAEAAEQEDEHEQSEERGLAPAAVVTAPRARGRRRTSATAP